MSKLSDHLHGSPVTNQEIKRVRDALLFEYPKRQRKITCFFILLILASSISTFGLVGDSVATVIGAMIVAPLMLPIMGLAFGISLTDRGIIMKTLIVSLLGTATAITVGFLLTWAFRNAINVESITQVMIRTEPRLIDLFAALATGLAGAFATGRKDVSDTLPGVAISISLVPPLSNVGILLACGRLDLAGGSLLLFVTNYLAILLTGSLMFTMMGYPRVYKLVRSRVSRWTTVGLTFFVLAVVIIPLSTTSYNTIQKTVAEGRAVGITNAWLKDSDYRLISVSSGNNAVRIVVTGQGKLPLQQDLQDALRGQLFELPVTLEIVPQNRSRFDTVEIGN